MKKIILFVSALFPIVLIAQQTQKVSREQKIADRKERINKLIKQEEEGALIYRKQSAFEIKLNTDGYGILYEHGKYKTITKTNIWWLELGERKDKREEKNSGSPTVSGSLIFFGSPYVFGKQNNFYYFKIGLGQQKLIGGKGNKNGVAVSANYGGGLTMGLLKPYYLQISDPNNGGTVTDIKYNNNDNIFLDPNIIEGASGFGKGFNEIKFVPGAHIRASLRFDYGRYNEVLSALEVGVNAEYYTQDMPILVTTQAKKFFFNAYIAIAFGKRK